MRMIISLAVVTLVGVLLLYSSRFWLFSLWDSAGLFGVKALVPQGGLLQRWLRGTDLAPYELLIWVILGFLILTMVQKIFDRSAKH